MEPLLVPIAAPEDTIDTSIRTLRMAGKTVLICEPRLSAILIALKADILPRTAGKDYQLRGF